MIGIVLGLVSIDGVRAVEGYLTGRDGLLFPSVFWERLSKEDGESWDQ